MQVGQAITLESNNWSAPMKAENAIQPYVQKYPWPRRRFIRGLLSGGIDVAATLLTNWEIIGKENLPKKGRC